MKWNVSVLRRSGECERTEVADFELSEFFNRIASVEGKAWVLSVERVGDVGDSALVEPDGDELVSQLGKRRWRVMGDPEDGWWVEVERVEKKADAQLCRRIEWALPDEVQRIADAMQAAGCVLERSREYPNRGGSGYVRVYLDCDLPEEVEDDD